MYPSREFIKVAPSGRPNTYPNNYSKTAERIFTKFDMEIFPLYFWTVSIFVQSE